MLFIPALRTVAFDHTFYPMRDTLSFLYCFEKRQIRRLSVQILCRNCNAPLRTLTETERHHRHFIAPLARKPSSNVNPSPPCMLKKGSPVTLT